MAIVLKDWFRGGHTMIFLNRLFSREDKSLRKTMDKIKENLLDDDQYLFCLQHGLSTNKSDYSESELQAMKAKALQEQVRAKESNRKKLHIILNSKGEDI